LFVKKSTFHVRGHDWYIDCYSCGIDEDSDTGWVSVCLCLSDHKEQVKAGCLPVICDGPDVWFFRSDWGARHQRPTHLQRRYIMATAPLMVSSNGTRTGPSTSRATVYRSDVRCTLKD